MSYINLIQKLIEFIEDNLHDPLTIKAAARHVHVSPFHFHRLFRILTGESVAMYIRKRRFSIAAMELLESDKRIIDIAVGLGFSSHESFTRSFKQLSRVTPEQYRIRGIPTFHYPRLSFTDNELFSSITLPYSPEVRIVTLDSLQVYGLRLKGLSDTCCHRVPSTAKGLESQVSA